MTDFLCQNYSFSALRLVLFKPFLSLYQTDWPMIPYMYNDLVQLITNILQLIVKPHVIKICKSGSDFKKIDLFKKENLLKQREISVGFAAEASIATMKQKDEVSANQINEFRKDCQSFPSNDYGQIISKEPTWVYRCEKCRLFRDKGNV